MNPRWAAVVTLLLATPTFGGCLQSVGDEGPVSLPDLTIGTLVHVTHGDAEGELKWSLLGVETRAGAYGIDEDLLVFQTEGSSEPPRRQHYTLNEKDISITETEAFGPDSWSLHAGTPLCFIPWPLHYAVLLSGAVVPSRGIAQSVAGRAFDMDLDSMNDQLLLTLENALFKTEASIRMVENEGGFELSIESNTHSTPEACKSVSESTTLSVELGTGDSVQLRHGLAESPWEPLRFDWWPGFDTPSATFPLERAVRALEADLAFQEFASGGEVWPFWLFYRERACSSLSLPLWHWAFLLAREDGKGFGACVAQLPGQDVLPLAPPLAFVVETWEESIPTFTPSHRVESVDFRFMDAAVAALAPGEVGPLVRFEFRITEWSGEPLAWVDVRREDPQREGYAYICEFDGSTGRVAGCSNLPAHGGP